MNVSCSPCTPLSAPKSLTEFSLTRYATQHLFLVNSLPSMIMYFLYVSLNSPQIEPSSSLLICCILSCLERKTHWGGARNTLNYHLAAKHVAMTFVFFVLGKVLCPGDKFQVIYDVYTLNSASSPAPSLVVSSFSKVFVEISYHIFFFHCCDLNSILHPRSYVHILHPLWPACGDARYHLIRLGWPARQKKKTLTTRVFTIYNHLVF